MNERKILVTGGAGFIGSHLVDRLLREGDWRITVVDDFNDFYSPDIKRANVAGHLTQANYRLVEADIRDTAAMAAVFDDNKVRRYCAFGCACGVRPSLSDPSSITKRTLTAR